MTTIESLVLVKVTPKTAGVCPSLDRVSLGFGWWRLEALGMRTKGRWKHPLHHFAASSS